MNAERDDVLLQVRGLSHRYGRVTGCHDVSFTLYPGEVLGLVGESGAGLPLNLVRFFGASKV